MQTIWNQRPKKAKRFLYPLKNNSLSAFDNEFHVLPFKEEEYYL